MVAYRVRSKSSGSYFGKFKSADEALAAAVDANEQLKFEKADWEPEEPEPTDKAPTVRQHVRNFLYAATLDDMRKELQLAMEDKAKNKPGAGERESAIRELMKEDYGVDKSADEPCPTCGK